MDAMDGERLAAFVNYLPVDEATPRHPRRPVIDRPRQRRMVSLTELLNFSAPKILIAMNIHDTINTIHSNTV